MSNTIVVHKHRTNVVNVDLGMDITGDTLTSEIRVKPDVDAALVATWTVAVTDATNGLLTLTLDDVLTAQITVDNGWMDIKRVTGSEPYAIFDTPIEVVFLGSVTA